MILAEIIAGGGLVHWLIYLLIVGLCIVLIWWAGQYCLTKLGAPAIALTLWNILFVLVGVIAIVNCLMGLAGHPFIAW